MFCFFIQFLLYKESASLNQATFNNADAKNKSYYPRCRGTGELFRSPHISNIPFRTISKNKKRKKKVMGPAQSEIRLPWQHPISDRCGLQNGRLGGILKIPEENPRL
ncbi:hypothetical protein CEXT_408111 [Caerostris extrusa]|uniref:Uncharacterized protein n=1 Tax=Caerostris extrusa TaxID=172846 RepID=A0AAV4NEI2_CAEEX|nr:hypothetical protein CEXT_408111 [Caerostris extrusa]